MLTPEPSVPLPFTVVLFRVLLPLMSTPAPLPVAFPVMLPSVMLPEMLTPLPLPEALPLIWPPFTEPLMSTPEFGGRSEGHQAVCALMPRYASSLRGRCR